MAIRIASKRDGFRRCGIEHPAAPVTYPDDRFTDEQLKQLKSEPMLIVDLIADEPKADDKKPLEKMTVAELKAYAEQNGIQLGEATKKDGILALIAAVAANTGNQ